MWGATAACFPELQKWVRLLLGSWPALAWLPAILPGQHPTPPRGSLLSTHHPQPPHDRPFQPGPGLLSRSVSRPGQPRRSLPGTGCPSTSLSQLLEPICLSSESSPPGFLEARLSPGRFPALGALGRPSRVPVRPFPGPPSSLAPSLPRLPAILLAPADSIDCSGFIPPGPRAPPSPPPPPPPPSPSPPPTTRRFTRSDCADHRLSSAGRIVK